MQALRSRNVFHVAALAPPAAPGSLVAPAGYAPPPPGHYYAQVQGFGLGLGLVSYAPPPPGQYYAQVLFF